MTTPTDAQTIQSGARRVEERGEPDQPQQAVGAGESLQEAASREEARSLLVEARASNFETVLAANRDYWNSFTGRLQIDMRMAPTATFPVIMRRQARRCRAAWT